MSVILYIFNIGYLVQHLGTILQIARIERKKDTEGVCLDTQILFLIGAISRIIWVNDTMLKDLTLTYVDNALAMISIIYTIYLCLFKYNSEYSITVPINNKSIPFFCRWYFIAVVSAVLSYFFFPGNEEQSYDIQMFVSMNIFVEAAGFLPQIYAVNKKKDSNIFSSFYVACLSISRVARLLFWFKMYMEDDSGFLYLIVADVLNLIMVWGFVYSFFKNFDSLILPTETKREDFGKKIY
jgi:hypothetical protein